MKTGRLPLYIHVLQTSVSAETRKMIEEKSQKTGKPMSTLIRECLEDTFSTYEESRLLDPDMPDGALLLHLGEMTAAEIRAARAAIRWANSVAH